MFAGAAMLASAARAATPCGPEFIHGDRYAIGNGTSGLQSTDVNDDGYPDLSITSTYPRRATVRLGNPDGTFGEAIDTDMGLYVYESILRDFTTDPFPDLVVLAAEGFVLMRGNGDGTFQAPEDLGEVLANLSAGDVNGDGKLDILGVPFDTPSIVVLLGRGDGTFQPPVETALTESPGPYVLGDVDGDETPDLVTTVPDGESVAIASGSGDGHFGSARLAPVGPELRDLILVDLEGDGDLDLAVASGSDVAVLRNEGNGEFGAAQAYAADRAVVDLRSGDIEGDGHADIVAFSSAYPSAARLSSFRVFQGPGDGTLRPGPVFLLDALYSGVAVADFGSNGTADVAGAALFTENLEVHLGSGDGLFRALPVAIIDDFIGTSATGDFDEDGRTDVALTIGENLVAYLAVGGGWFAPSTPQAGAAGGTVADFDLDGHLDYASAGDGAIWVLPGNGDGTFRPASPNSISNGRPDGIVTGDFDADRKPDLAIYELGDVGFGSGIEVYFGRGDGTFEPAAPVSSVDNGAGLAAADFNGDGRDDLALIRGAFSEATLEVYVAAPGRTFFPSPTRSIPSNPRGLAAGDFRNNGRPDIAVSFFDEPVHFFTNRSDGFFEAGVPIAGSTPGAGLITGDFDGGGHLDLAVNRRDSVSILHGRGNGGFEAPVEYFLPGVRPFHALDADGDGSTDIVGVNGDSHISGLSTLRHPEPGLRPRACPRSPGLPRAVTRLP